MSAETCTCPTDWHALRAALGLSVHQFALIVHLDDRTVRYQSTSGPKHCCMSAGPQAWLRAYLKPRADILWEHGIPYPYPEDLAAPVVICSKCGEDESKHRRCQTCGVLIGHGHLPESVDHPMRCSMCGDWITSHPRNRELVTA